MQNNELFNIYFSYVEREIQNLNYQLHTFLELESKIQLLREFIQSQEFDLNIYKEISRFLSLPYTNEQIQKYINFLNQNFDYETFESQITSCKSHIDHARKTVELQLGEFENRMLQRESLVKKLNDFENLYKVKNNNGLIKNEEIELIIKNGVNSPLSTDEIGQLVLDIVMHNSILIKEKYEAKINSSRRRKKRVQQVDADFKTMLDKAKEISTLDYELSEELECAIELLSYASDVDDRVSIYESFENLENTKSIIIYDLKNNIIPKILNNEINNDDAKKILEEVLAEYSLCLNYIAEENNIEKSFFEKLDELKLDNEKKLCMEIDVIMIQIKDILFGEQGRNANLTSEVYNSLFYKFEELKKAYIEYKGVINILYLDPNNEENLKLKQSTSSALEKKFNDLNLFYESNVISEEKYIELADEFYSNSGQEKNIYIFLGEDENQSYIDQDMNGKLFENKDLMDSVLRLLHQNVDNNFYAEGNHRAKTDNYSEEFINKYRIKSLKSPQVRISYGRYNSSIGQIYPEYGNNPHIILLFALGYGKVDTSKKRESFDEAWKRCFDNQSKVDEIIRLFNVDWSKLSKEEAESHREVLDSILRDSKIKLGKMIEKSKIKGGNQNGIIG